MTETVDVTVLRVFTDERGEHGNELGVIFSSALTVDREQSIASELGFSETVFVDAVEDGGRTAAIRIFTPVTELPFAGHPSVGTAWWLAREGKPVRVLHERAGDVAVDTERGTTWITARAEWAPEFEWILLAEPADVDAIDSAAFVAGHHYAYAWINEDAGHLRSRMFAPAMGIAEDEATGAAAVRLTSVLGRDLRIVQGAGSELVTRILDGGLIRVGGRTTFDRTITVAVQ